jgi:hypothetical protein
VIGALATHAMGSAAALLPAVCLLGMLLMIDATAQFPVVELLPKAQASGQKIPFFEK